MRDHGSIGLPLGMGSFGGFFFPAFVCFWLLIFLAFSFSVCFFLFSAGRKKRSLAHGILVGNQREKTILGRGFLSFFLFIWWQFCIVQILSGPKTFLHISSVFFRSLIRSFLSFFFFFFLLSPILWLGISFLFFLLSLWLEIFLLFFFCFLPFFGWEFSFFSFCFLPLFDWEFSFFSFLFFFFASEGKDWHSNPGSRFMVS